MSCEDNATKATQYHNIQILFLMDNVAISTQPQLLDHAIVARIKKPIEQAGTPGEHSRSQAPNSCFYIIK